MKGEDREPNFCAICRTSRTRYILTHSGFDIVRCKRCGLVFVKQRPLPALIESTYNEQYNGFDARHSEKKLRIARRLLRQIGKYEKPGRLLEIGCGTGDFLQAALERGWRVEGTEISAFAAQKVRERLGVKVHCGDVEGLPLSRESFDVICMFQVLEHLIDPLKAMRRVAQLLRPGGLLALSTPNIDTLIFRYLGKKYYPFLPAEHLYYFSPATLTRLLRLTGFEIVNLSTRNEDTYLVFRRALSVLGVNLPETREDANSVVTLLLYKPFSRVLRKLIIPLTDCGRQIQLFARRRSG